MALTPPLLVSAQAYVLVSKVRLTSDTAMDMSAFSPPPREQTTALASTGTDAARDSAGSAESDDDEPPTPGSTRILTTALLTLPLNLNPTLTNPKPLTPTLNPTP